MGEESDDGVIFREATQLATVLKEMKEGLDKVNSRVRHLTSKVKANQFPTAEGISYLETKHLLLLSYCQSLVYYLLRKAQGLSIAGHPVVRSLVEIRLFLEKIRPIDKKLQYQIQKLTTASSVSSENAAVKENATNTSGKVDLLKYRPNPDMLTSKVDPRSDVDDVYKPPKFAPALMEEEKESKQERNSWRKERHTLRQASQSDYVRGLMNDFEGRPEEIREVVGTESRELSQYKAKMEARARREEELFTRAPLTKMEKKKAKHLMKSRNGLLGLADSFYDEIKTLPLEDDMGDKMNGFSGDSGMRKMKRRKSKH